MILNFLFWILCGVYIIGWAFFCLSFFHIREHTNKWGFRVLIFGLICHLWFIINSAITTPGYIFGSLSGLFLFLSLLTILIFFVLSYSFPNQVFGVTFPPISIFFLFISILGANHRIVSVSMPDSSTLFGEIVMWAHASLSMVAYLLFIIASLMAAFFLYQENRIKKKRLALEQGNVPSLGVLGDINYKVIAIGFVLFTVGLLLGVGLNAAARGEIPRISIRQTLPVITWLIYVIYLIDRSLNGLRGKLTAIWSIIAGAIAVVSFIYEMSFLTSRI